MKKPPAKRAAFWNDGAQYNVSAGVRGKYVDRYQRGSNVVLLDPELTEAFAVRLMMPFGPYWQRRQELANNA
jgi:hypothetical protein